MLERVTESIYHNSAVFVRQVIFIVQCFAFGQCGADAACCVPDKLYLEWRHKRGHNWVLISIGYSVLLYEFKLRYYKNPKLLQ